ncbi:hypothetical protein ACTXT7_009850 [Hymenolepis weldensis]
MHPNTLHQHTHSAGFRYIYIRSRLLPHPSALQVTPLFDSRPFKCGIYGKSFSRNKTLRDRVMAVHESELFAYFL